jgi:hypothetical protein
MTSSQIVPGTFPVCSRARARDPEWRGDVPSVPCCRLAYVRIGDYPPPSTTIKEEQENSRNMT